MPSGYFDVKRDNEIVSAGGSQRRGGRAGWCQSYNKIPTRLLTELQSWRE